MKLLLTLLEKFGVYGNEAWIGYCLHESSTTCIICRFLWDAPFVCLLMCNSAYVLSNLILKLSEEFEIMLSF